MKYVKYYDDWIKEEKGTYLSRLFSFLFRQKRDSNRVYYWLLELDEGGNISKEISIGNDGDVISIAPYKSNRGEWVDSNVTLDYKDYEQISPIVFGNYWSDGIK